MVTDERKTDVRCCENPCLWFTCPASPKPILIKVFKHSLEAECKVRFQDANISSIEILVFGQNLVLNFRTIY